MSEQSDRLKVENRRNAVDTSARDLMSHLLQLRQYEPLSGEDEALLSALVRRGEGGGE